MAGYIFSVSLDGWNSFCTENLTKGYFTPLTLQVNIKDSTPRKRKIGNKVLAATFGDLISMHPGDNVYFLSNRKIYGIGLTVQVGSDCKYDNYLNASALLPNDSVKPDTYLTTSSTQARWVILFEPCPYFFKKGVDMDDVLRYKPQAFKVLRAFEGLSFIKIENEENQALREYISLVNEPFYRELPEHVFPFDKDVHKRLSGMDLSPYLMNINRALSRIDNKEFVLTEMLIESALLQELSTRSNGVLGHWNYVTHQLIASPFKPLKYIDKIDIFGYRFSTHYKNEPKLITKYLLVELKKGIVNQAALEQTMQYVDWVCNEYASGDYSKIEAYVVGERVIHDIRPIIADICQRSFIAETHPAKPEKWADLKIVKYSIDENVHFELYSI